MWQRNTTLAKLNEMSTNSMIDNMGIKFTQLNKESIEATMPVNEKTKQPFGLLHGGASVTLAETLGSVASYLCTSGDTKVLGLEINANHLRPVKEGIVRGECHPIHLGRFHHVWQITIYDEQDRICCLSRLTVAVIEKYH